MSTYPGLPADLRPVGDALRARVRRRHLRHGLDPWHPARGELHGQPSCRGIFCSNAVATFTRTSFIGSKAVWGGGERQPAIIFACCPVFDQMYVLEEQAKPAQGSPNGPY